MDNGFFWLFSLVFGFFSPPKQSPMLIEQVTEPLELGEGPHWDSSKNVLYFVDIFEQNIHCFDPETKRVTRAHLTGGSVSVIVPIAGKENMFLVGCGTDLVEVSWNPRVDNDNPSSRVISTVDVGRAHTRFNDGKVDPQGRFWAGTMGQINGGELVDNMGSLYRFDHYGTPTEILYPVSISNGLAWNYYNDTFYYADSRTLKVEVFDYDQFSGDITNRRTIFNLAEHNIPGLPDGLTLDTDGNIWLAVTEGGRVIQIDPKSGALLYTIYFPVTKVNSVAFGGYNLDILYVATARRGLTEKELREQPLAGAMFSVSNLGVRGRPMLSCKMF